MNAADTRLFDDERRRWRWEGRRGLLGGKSVGKDEDRREVGRAGQGHNRQGEADKAEKPEAPEGNPRVKKIPSCALASNLETGDGENSREQLPFGFQAANWATTTLDGGMMKPHKSFLFVPIGLLLPAPAFSHHLTGGETPLTFVQGFSSGLAHPVIGFDHFLFLLIAGVLAYSFKFPLRYALPVLFVVSALAGTSLHLVGFNLSSVEIPIALSVILGGGMVMLRRRMSVLAASVFFVLAGTFHGYAYAESIVGAQSAPLLAYLAGLALIQGAVVTGMVTGLAKLNTWAKQSSAVRAERFVGGAALLAGAVSLVLSFV